MLPGRLERWEREGVPGEIVEACLILLRLADRLGQPLEVLLAGDDRPTQPPAMGGRPA